MEKTPSENKKSDHVVIRKVVTSFIAMLVLLLASSLTMSYVANRGFVSTTENAEALALVGPLQELDRSARSLNAIYKMISLGNTEESVKLLDKLATIKTDYNKAIEILSKANATGINLESLKTKYTEVEKKGGEMAMAFIDGDNTKGKALSKSVEEVALKLEKEIADTISTTFSSKTTEVRDFFEHMRLLSFVLMAVSTVFAIIIIVSIVRGIRKALELEQVTLKEKITDVVQRLSLNTETLSEASVNLNEANEKLASSSEEQSQAAAQVVSAIEEMKATVEETLRQTKQSSAISDKTQNMATSGRTAVQKMSDSMTEIQSANQKLTEIVNLMSEITVKTNVINDIVFQTRLLSFNAAVEAARAGDHGKGFAVVADEIGNLAIQSGQSAQAINQLLKDGNEKVNSVVDEIQERTGVAEQISSECVEIFNQLETLNTELNEAITQINSATNEVKVGIEHAATSITQIDHAINLNTQITRDTQVQSAEVKSGSNDLVSSVGMLKSIIE